MHHRWINSCQWSFHDKVDVLLHLLFSLFLLSISLSLFETTLHWGPALCDITEGDATRLAMTPPTSCCSSLDTTWQEPCFQSLSKCGMSALFSYLLSSNNKIIIIDQANDGCDFRWFWQNIVRESKKMHKPVSLHAWAFLILVWRYKKKMYCTFSGGSEITRTPVIFDRADWVSPPCAACALLTSFNNTNRLLKVTAEDLHAGLVGRCCSGFHADERRDTQRHGPLWGRGLRTHILCAGSKTQQ